MTIIWFGDRLDVADMRKENTSPAFKNRKDPLFTVSVSFYESMNRESDQQINALLQLGSKPGENSPTSSEVDLHITH